MFKNYIKIAWRNLIKNKLYSSINIIGLSIGVACSLLISLYVWHESTYDDFHVNGSNIYRLTRDIKVGENKYHFAIAPAAVAPALLSDFPEVKKAVRLRTFGSFLVKRPEMNQSFKEESLICVDSGFFDLFSFPLIAGEKDRQFKAANTVTISREMANKYFLGESPIGKTLIFDGDENFTVTGVYENMPANSHFQFDFLLSMATIAGQANNERWVSNNFFTYIEIHSQVNPEELLRKINQRSDKELIPILDQLMHGKTLEEFKAEGNTMDFSLQPLNEIYLTSDYTFDVGRMGNSTYVYLFGFTAIFIILLACINFMNLSTARSGNRAKEVGVRKALGSNKSNLIGQFLTESIMISVFSFIIGVLLVYLLLPLFNNIIDKQLFMPSNSLSFYLTLLLSAILVGLLAGLYPAFYLSAFNPTVTLKGKLATTKGNGGIRSGLVVFQFFTSILLIIGTIAVYKQLSFIQNRNIGFDKNQVLLINDPYMLGDSRESFKKEIEKLPQVSSASYSGFLPINGYNRSDNTFWPGNEDAGNDNMVGLQLWQVDEDYISTMGMNLVNGRDFNNKLTSDSASVILNQRAFEMFSFEEGGDNYIQTNKFNPTTGEVYADKFDVFKVIGIVEDFHFESMKEEIGPVGLFLGKSTDVLSVKIATNDIENTLIQMESTWNDFDRSLPFSYDFLDDEFGTMYNAELKLAQVFSIFSGLAILIGCMGLFALASFMAEQKAKEIGIRKVLGASIRGIVLLQSKEFSKLVIYAFVLAVPLGWWGISTWLQNYNYHIDIGWEIFAIAGVLAFIIASFTVSYHSIKSALSNPVDSLKNE